MNEPKQDSASTQEACSLHEVDRRHERITREGITVAAGQVWRDLDKRCNGRTRAVLEVKGGKALMDGPVRRWLAVERMHRHSAGWSLVSPIE